MPAVAILCNGPSLDDHELRKIDCETIGLNASWVRMKSSYHVMADEEQWQHYTTVTGKTPDTITNLFTGKNGPEGATELSFLDSNRPRFSFDPYGIGVYLCGTVTWVALQLAVHMRRSPIYMVGLDLSPRDDGQEKMKGAIGHWTQKAEGRQRELMGFAAGLLGPSGVEVINVNERSRSKCWAFPFRTFKECFG